MYTHAIPTKNGHPEPDKCLRRSQFFLQDDTGGSIIFALTAVATHMSQSARNVGALYNKLRIWDQAF